MVGTTDCSDVYRDVALGLLSFFFQAEDGIRDSSVTGVQTCALPICYYARARNLHRAALRILDEHGGELPESFDALASLPGIGRSTAGAILALARGQRFPILDGNARRVLSRYFGVPGHSSESSVARRLWELSERSTPHDRV